MANQNSYIIVIILSVLIFIASIIAILYGIHDVMLGYQEQEYFFSGEGFWENFIKKLQTEKKFFLFTIYTVFWAATWIVNTLSIKLGFLELPLYFIREQTLKSKLPDVPVNELPVYSTYNLIGILMDFGVLLILLYIIYANVRHGIQKMEYLVDYFFQSRVFFALFLSITFLHILGHLPFELYGRFGGIESGLLNEPEIGLGTSFTEGWFAFDKLTHFLSALLLILLLIQYLNQQQIYSIQNFTKQPIKEFNPNLYIYTTALTYLLALGVIWEFTELILNIIMFELGAINLDHFNLEYNDALKDLVFDFFGGLVGIFVTLIEYKFEK